MVKILPDIENTPEEAPLEETESTGYGVLDKKGLSCVCCGAAENIEREIKLYEVNVARWHEWVPFYGVERFGSSAPIVCQTCKEFVLEADSAVITENYQNWRSKKRSCNICGDELSNSSFFRHVKSSTHQDMMTLTSEDRENKKTVRVYKQNSREAKKRQKKAFETMVQESKDSSSAFRRHVAKLTRHHDSKTVRKLIRKVSTRGDKVTCPVCHSSFKSTTLNKHLTGDKHGDRSRQIY